MPDSISRPLPSGSNQPYLALGDSDVVTAGQPVQALGIPYGRTLNIGRDTLDSVVPEITTTVGTISALRTNGSGERRVLQIDANINPGNSGGPVVNKDGFVVGVVCGPGSEDAAPASPSPIPIDQSQVCRRVSADFDRADAGAPAAPWRPCSGFDAKGHRACVCPTACPTRPPVQVASRHGRRAQTDDRDSASTASCRRRALGRLEQEAAHAPRRSSRSVGRQPRQPHGARGRSDRAPGRASGTRAERQARSWPWPTRSSISAAKRCSRDSWLRPNSSRFNEGVAAQELARQHYVQARLCWPASWKAWRNWNGTRAPLNGACQLPSAGYVEAGAPSTCTGLADPGGAG